MNKVYLHTGTNLGDKAANLEQANAWIRQEIGPIVLDSSVHQTAPWGITTQPDFLNQALLVHTTLSASEVLAKIHWIERKMGRVRRIKWGERCIDIDILFFNDAIIEEENLTIPHPYLHLREFVLAPLREIAPELIHPVFGKSIWQLSADLANAQTSEP
jgi:2-amino-4-hydroxy-6-hydroxymethyldihydropteridine diphosphokinase